MEANMPYSLEKNYFSRDEHWKTWKGRIVRAIVLNNVNTKSTILKATNLKEEEFERGLNELFPEKLVEKLEDGKYWVNSKIWKKCQIFFDELQETLVNWVNEWRENQGMASVSDENPSHFYLPDWILSRFSESLFEGKVRVP
jgi:hypothetical protein